MLHEPKIATTTRKRQSLIGILSNCASTANREMLSRVRALVDDNPNLFHFEFEDITSISQGLKMMADARVSLLVINGGDGTIQATLSNLINNAPFDRPPPIAILPGGKTNMIARDLGTRMGPDKALARLIRLARTDKIEKHIVTRSLIGLNMNDGEPLRYGMFFGGAAIVKGIFWSREHVHKNGIPTRLGHGIAIARMVLGAALRNKASPLLSSPAQIALGNGERFSGRFNLILATTLSRLLVGLKPFGREGTGALQISVIDDRKSVMRRSLFALITGRFSKGGVPGLYTRRSHKMTILCPDSVTLDGEIYTPLPDTPITLHGDRSLSFVHF